MKKGFLFCFAWFLSLAGWAQQATLEGKVVDESSEPLFSVTVVSGNMEGTTTDFDGRFSLPVEPGEVTLIVSYIGYETYYDTLNVAEGQVLDLGEITISASATQTSTVVVGTTKRGKSIAKETVTVDVVSADLMKNNNIVDASSAIERVPGVTVLDGQASIRGGSGYAYGVGSRVILVVDDIPLLSPERNEALWDFVPVEMVDQIEVVKGAASVQYGSSALNGIVHARTKWPTSSKPKETNVTTFFGVYDRPEVREARWWRQPGVTSSFREDPHRMGIYASHARRINRQHDIVVSGYSNSNQTHLQQEFNHQLRASFKWRYRPKNVEGLTLVNTVSTMFRNRSIFFLWDGFEEGLFTPLGGGAAYQARYQIFTLDPKLTYFFGKNKRHSIRSINRFYYDKNLNNIGSRRENSSYFFYNDFNYTYEWGKRGGVNGTLMAGASNRFYKVWSNGLDRLIEDGNSFRLNESAFYAQGDVNFQGLTITAGARMESILIDRVFQSVLNDTSILGDNTLGLNGRFLFTKPVFRLGANYQFRKNNFVRASVGQSFRVPSLAERFVDEGLAEDFRIYPNPGILPEEGFTVEFGYKRDLRLGKNFSGYADAAVFYQQFKPMVEFVPGPYERLGVDEDGDGNWDTGIGFRSVNVSRARIFGYEFTLSGGGQFGDVPLSVLAGYTYAYAVDARKDEDFNSFGKIFTNSFRAFRLTDEDYEQYNNPSTRSSSIINSMLSYRFRHLVKVDIQSGYKRWTVGTAMRYYSYMDRVDDVFTRVVPGFEEYRFGQNYRGEFIWDVRTGYKITDGISVNLIVRNLLNDLNIVRPGKPEAPRSFTIQGSWTF